MLYTKKKRRGTDLSANEIEAAEAESVRRERREVSRRNRRIAREKYKLHQKDNLDL